MTTFLSWVYSQASKVYDWFGSAYYTLRNAASNAWNWAVTQANNALVAAQNYAYNLFRHIDIGIDNIYSYVRQLISNAIQGMSDDIASLYDWIEYKFSQIENFAVDQFWNAINSVHSFAQSIYDTAVYYANQLFDGVRSWVLDTFAFILQLRDRLIQLVSIFTDDFISAIIRFFQNDYKSILSFLSNPLVFIFDIIQDKFISFLCYVLAHALGTTIYELPNDKTWKG